MRALPALATLLLAALVAAAGARAAPVSARLRAVHTFALAIGDGDLRGDLARRYRGYDLLVVDGVEASRTQVARLRAAGKIVLAYLDVGTIERGRPWYRAARRYRLDFWRAWGEWYADVDRRGFRRLIARSVAPRLLRKGFDGLFLDNTDMVETHRAERPGMNALVAALARVVHARGGLLFTQNGEDSIAPTLRYYDGWNREDVTSTFDFASRRYVRVPAREHAAALRALRRMRASGRLVTATDYVRGGDARTAAAAARAACGAGALTFVSNISLTRIPPRPAACPLDPRRRQRTPAATRRAALEDTQ